MHFAIFHYVNSNRFFTKKSVFIPTKTSIISTAVFVIILFLLFVMNIHQFLSRNKPVLGDGIIIEGWMPDYCLKFTADLIKNKTTYKKIFVTGGPLEKGSYLKDFKTFADLGGLTLNKLSIPDTNICVVPAPYSKRDRTYTSAIALKKWLDSSGCSIHTFDVCSYSTHTRRSALLFQKVLGKKYKIGSISILQQDYDPKFWWKTSQGVRSVIDESIAYIYAFLFIFSNY